MNLVHRSLRTFVGDRMNMLNLYNRPPVSAVNCSKIAAASFTIGVIIGYKLNRVIRRMAEGFLRRIQKG